jgi:hypothetical protein
MWGAITFWTKEVNSEVCLDFPVPAPPDRNSLVYMFCQYRYSCSEHSIWRHSLQVSRIDPGVAEMPSSCRSFPEE